MILIWLLKVKGIPITARLKEIKKRRALRGKERVELLMNSEGKRTVVLLNPSFFTSLIPSSLCETRVRHRNFKQCIFDRNSLKKTKIN